MDDSLYDEFGNYIGPELSDSDQVKRIMCSLQASVLHADAASSKGRA